MVAEVSKGRDVPQVGALVDPTTEHGKWRCRYRLEKWHRSEDKDTGLAPDETIEREGNLLVTAGITALLTLLIGGGGTAFNAANAAIGVGDSSTAATIGQTNLSAATNKLRKTVKQAPGVAANVVTFVADFVSAEANFVWNEFGVFNSNVDASGTMLNRAVAALGTKAAGSTWTLTVTITIT